MEKWFRVDDLEREAIELPQDVELVEYSVSGVQFEIDLNKQNREQLYNLLLRYMKNSRRVGSGRVPDELAEVLGDDMPVSISAKAAAGPKPAPVTDNGTPPSRRQHTSAEKRTAREWAKAHGLNITTGPIPSDVWRAVAANDPRLLRASRFEQQEAS